ncbi:MAG: COX15/CtaA family protein [Verrucomicrobiales bacterium]
MDAPLRGTTAAVSFLTPNLARVPRTTHNPWLTAFAVATAVCTLILIAVGGLVTSHGAGMAVPDWPTTYGYNMFLFPFSQWIGGIFYEHSHRLIASGVGFLTIILCVWIWIKDSRPWMRWLGVVALIAVCIQGLLGGLRVTLYKDELGIFHATLAQLYFVLIGAIALFLSRKWQNLGKDGSTLPKSISRFALLITGLILLQLILGASMRHQHAGLAVPDFPLAYGKIWPPTNQEFLESVNTKRLDVRDFHPITAGHIHLHMTHRIVAFVIFALAAMFAVRCTNHARANKEAVSGAFNLKRWGIIWFVMILLQAVLGAITVWSNKAADIATGHVVLGALSFLTGFMIYLTTRRLSQAAECRDEIVLPRSAPHGKSLGSATMAG